jgi:LysR family transcriptional regulator (chromosome initiation inhibitor)
MMRLDPGQLQALASAVSEGSFDAAARALHVTPSAISQRIKALEMSVGRVLLTRGKPVLATESGQVLLRLARQIDTITADAALEIGVYELAGAPAMISLGVNADSLSTWLLPALAAVTPSLVFDLHRDDQARTADLLRQGTVMAAVTSSGDPVPGCSVRRLGAMRYRPTATADFAAEWFGEGVTAKALALAPVVVFDREDQLQDTYLRRRVRRLVDPPRHYVPDSTAFVSALRLGMGWGMLPDLQREAPTKKAGGASLITLEPRAHVDVVLYWQQWRLRSASLDRVAQAVQAAAAAALR